ncbi:hypothetical protein [Sorangium sp. So ce1000]|uniref:hypothetical protein n=1 Tax=Sorangium sp. So ce1000 TaxID=3133325 RepID=UPI003F6279D8
MDAFAGSLPVALKIMLGLVAFVTGFVAIGGETYHPGSGPFLRRLTTRGRVAIACAMLTLLLGTMDQMVSEAESKKREQELSMANADAKRARDEAERLLKEQLQHVSTLEEEAQKAKKALEDVGKNAGAAAGGVEELKKQLTESGDLLKRLNGSLKSLPQNVDVQAVRAQLQQISTNHLAMATDLGIVKSELDAGGAIRKALNAITAHSLDSTALNAALGPILTGVGNINTGVGDIKRDVGAMQTELPRIHAAIAGLTSGAAASIDSAECRNYFDTVATRMATWDDAQKAAFQRVLTSNRRLWGEASAVPEQRVWVSAACTSALAAVPN